MARTYLKPDSCSYRSRRDDEDTEDEMTTVNAYMLDLEETTLQPVEPREAAIEMTTLGYEEEDTTFTADSSWI